MCDSIMFKKVNVYTLIKNTLLLKHAETIAGIILKVTVTDHHPKYDENELPRRVCDPRRVF